MTPLDVSLEQQFTVAGKFTVRALDVIMLVVSSNVLDHVAIVITAEGTLWALVLLLTSVDGHMPADNTLGEEPPTTHWAWELRRTMLDLVLTQCIVGCNEECWEKKSQRSR